MSNRRAPSTSRLSRLLYGLTLAAAAGLISLVILAPLVDDASARPLGPRRVVAVFARDLTLRRTAVASALGLAVTAGVFFRNAPGGPEGGRGARKTPGTAQATPPGGGVGA